MIIGHLCIGFHLGHYLSGTPPTWGKCTPVLMMPSKDFSSKLELKEKWTGKFSVRDTGKIAQRKCRAGLLCR